jgi:hypothetical protein
MRQIDNIRPIVKHPRSMYIEDCQAVSLLYNLRETYTFTYLSLILPEFDRPDRVIFWKYLHGTAVAEKLPFAELVVFITLYL